MNFIKTTFVSLILILTLSLFASAQTEERLKTFFEGQYVEVKIDMPASKDGINVFPERGRTIDYNRYGNLLKANGASLLEGDRVLITKVKVKGKHIEFQLGGGGYGTFGDETGSVSVPTASKTQREKDLEKRLKYEEDDRDRRRIREELSYLQGERERADNANRAAAAVAEQVAKARVQEKRLRAGSRFNIKFDRKLTDRDLTPQLVIDALSQYVYFSDLK